MKARKGLFLDIMEQEFGLKEGDKINIKGAYRNPYKITENGLMNGSGEKPRNRVGDIILNKTEFEKVKDTVTVINKATGKEIEISLASAKAMELI